MLRSNMGLQQTKGFTDLMSLGITPIKVDLLLSYLKNYTCTEDAKILADGFVNGFNLQFEGARVTNNCENLLSVKQNPQVAWEKVMKEVSLGRIAGPFDTCPISNLKLSPIGLIPKKDGTWRLIQHLSYPSGGSINDFIDPQLCSVNYTSMDEVVESIISLGNECLMGKADIKSAFRLLPVRREDFCLLGFRLQGKYFVDKMLPMGCALSCALWEKFATFLEWLLKYLYHDSVLHHYLDDYIFLGEKMSNNCLQTMLRFEQLCKSLGVPLADDKTVGPTTVLVFLGLEINSVLFQIQIPREKIYRLKLALNKFLNGKKVTLKELQALVGLLNFCTRAIPVARAFNRRFYDAMSGLTKPFHHVRVSASMKADIMTWISFIEHFNGYCSFPELNWNDSSTLDLFTDSAGSQELGCAAVFGCSWVFYPWPREWHGTNILKDITFLELVPVVLAFLLWAPCLQNKKINLHIDNQSLVCILNKKSSKSKLVMHLVRPLILVCMQNHIQFKASHVEGISNVKADSLSRCQWQRFREVAPLADPKGQEIPESFQQLICSLKSIT